MPRVLAALPSESAAEVTPPVSGGLAKALRPLHVPEEPRLNLTADSGSIEVEKNIPHSSLHLRHHRQAHQSAPDFSPTRAAPKTTTGTPILWREPGSRHSQIMGLTGDGRSRTPTTRLTAQSNLSRTSSSERGISPSSQHSRSQPDNTPKSTTQSRFGFFTNAFSSSRMASPTQLPTILDDDLCDFDIEAALAPLPSPVTGDELSPAAYKNLQMNATGLLHRMQEAYRQQAQSIREMQAEHEAQKEEVEEMELRTLSFKSQLEKMAATAAQQQEAMAQLMAELQAEKHARIEERISREKMFRAPDEASVVCSEDLGVDELEKRKRWRVSNSTVNSSVDTECDSAESESIFSRSRSPTALTAPTEVEASDVPTILPMRPMPVHKSRPAQPLTAFQRLVKGISASRDESGNLDAGCRSCRGRDVNAAWDTISILRDENIALKQRVAELELAVEAALDVVNGIKM